MKTPTQGVALGWLVAAPLALRRFAGVPVALRRLAGVPEPLRRFVSAPLVLRRMVGGCAVSLVMLAVASASERVPADKLATERTVALSGLDEEMARFAALLPKVEEAEMKAGAQRAFEGFEARRAALGKAFDQTAYDELRLKLLVEYQRLLLWISPPRLPKPAAKEASR